MLHRTLPSLLALAALGLVGCVDNSGGEPPAGESLEFEVAIESPDLFCGDFADSADLLRTEADVDAFVADCGDMVGDAATIEEELDAEVAALVEGEGILIVNAELGGCTRNFALWGVYLDGDVLRPWIVKEDTAYGRANVACTADIGQGQEIVKVSGVADVASVELSVGRYNPELPGGPVVAQDDIAEE